MRESSTWSKCPETENASSNSSKSLYTKGMSRVLLSCVVALSSSVALAQVVNSSFEDPIYGANTWQYRPGGVPGWTFLNNAGLANGSTPWGPTGNTGNQYGFIQTQGNGGRISQNVGGFVPGTTYRITYWLRRRTDFMGANIQVFKDGLPISVPVMPANHMWVQHASDWFVASSNSHVIEFRTDNTNDHASLIDDVQVATWPPPPYGLPTNPSFEFPILNSGWWTERPGGILTAWVFEGTSGIANGASSWGSSGQIGQQYAYIQRDASIRQQVGDFVPGRSYHAQWFMMRRNGGVGANVGQPIRALMDNVEIAPFQIQPDAIWRNFASHPFTAISTSGVLRFEGGSDIGDRTSLIDNVRIFENEEVVPDAISFQRGQQTGGTVSSLFESDNDYLRARQFLVFSQTDPPVQMTVEGTVPPGDPIYLNIHVESAISLSGFNQEIQLLNVQSNTWTSVSETSLTNTDSNRDIVRLDDASSYVHPVTGKIKCRLWVKRAGPAFSSLWTYRVDKVRFSVALF